MQIGHVAGANRTCGKSQGYLGLPIKDEMVYDPASGRHLNQMTSAWFPTPDEILAIIAGAPIYVHIYGTAPPPMCVSVGARPEDASE